MSGAKNRPGRQAAPALAAITHAPELTASERRMLELFRATTDQQMLLGFAGVCAKTAPRHVRPSLHLVSGGAA